MSSRATTAARLLAFVLLGFALPAVALVRAPDLSMKLDDYSLTSRSFCFPSGLRILFQEDHTEPIVSTTMVVDRGSGDDPLGQEGLAHLVEHLWFRSQHGTAPKIWDLLHEMGASLNATTGSDLTTYMTVAPADTLPALLRLEALRLTDTLANVTDKEVNLEREIVRNELRMRYENSSGSFLQYIREKLYPPEHPYARLGIGSHETISRLTLKNAQDFVATNYVPSNATLMVVGDFSIAQVPDLLRTGFPGSLFVDPKNPDAELKLVDCPVRITGPSAEPPPPVDTSLSTYKAGVEKRLLVLAWSLPGAYRENEMLLNLSARSLNLPVQKALNWHRNYRHEGAEEGSYGGCFMFPEEQGSTAVCTIQIGSRVDPEGLAHRVANHLNMMWEVQDTTNGEIAGSDMLAYSFAKSRWWTMLSLFQDTENVASLFGRGTETAKFTHFTGNANYFSTNFERLNKIDPTAPRLIAEKYLNRDRMVAVVLEPFEQGDVDLESKEATYVGRPREPVVDTAIPLERLDANYLKKLVKPPGLEKLHTFEMANGLEVVMLPHGEAPLAQSMLLFRGASLSEPRPGFHDFADSRVEIPDYITNEAFRIVGDWSFNNGIDNQYLGITASSGNLDGQIYLLRRALDEMEISATRSREDYVEAVGKGWIRYRNRPDWWAGHVADQHLLAGHPLASWIQPADLEALEKTKTKEVKAYFDEILQPANATLFIVGRIDPQKAEEYVSTYFGDWKAKGASGKERPLAPGPPAPPATRKVVVLNKDNATQTGVHLQCQLEPLRMDNGEAKEVLSATLDEMAWVALREESAVTYGAGAYVRNYPGGTSLLGLSTLVQNDAAGMAARVFTQLSDRAAAGDIDPELVTLTKAQQARKYALGQQTTSQVLRRLSSPWVYGFGWESLMGHGPRLAGVAVDDLKAEMARCNGKEILTLVGPQEVVTDRLKAEGIAFEVYDWRAEADRLWEQQEPREFKRELKRRAEAAAKGEEAGEAAPDEGEGGEEGDPAPAE